MGQGFRYRRLGYLAFNVTDIAASTRFAEDVFGLDFVNEDKDGARYFRVGAGHHDLIMTPSDIPGLARSSWELETQEDLDAAFAKFKAIGLNPTWMSDAQCDGLAIARGFRLIDPIIGAVWEYFVEMTNICSPLRNALTSFQGGKHFGIGVPDNREMTKFLCDNLGFKLSDYIGDYLISLVRAWPNPNHHSIGVLNLTAGAPRFHHIAFMVKEIDDIGRLFNRCRNGGVDIHFGIGRHPTSGSIHLYIYGPDNFVWEYTLGMEQFPEVGARQPRRMSSAPEHYDLWGAKPDDSRLDLLPYVHTELKKATVK